MKKLHSFLSFLLVITFLTLAENSAGQEIPPVIVLAFGDSITQGLARKYDGEGGIIRWGNLEPPMGRPTTNWGYPIELDKIIEAELPIFLDTGEPVSATVHNWGHMGFTSGDMLDCQDHPKNCIDTVLASNSSAGFILILLGANDIYQNIASIDTRFNLGQIIDKCREANIEPILGTLSPITDSHAPFPHYKVNDIYNLEIRDLALEKEVLLADHYVAMEEDWNLYTSGDGLHLSRSGNEKMARTWYETLVQSEQFKTPPLTQIYFLLLGNSSTAD
ncbi:MAG: SGNH/GDSL hydrolase family protein [Deltaproteobacteria bacterium]|nr:SGNH/GDSL hydrolase family protein [Deltaproteobacteria bacterium]